MHREIYEKNEQQLYDWVTETGYGIMGIDFGNIPEECFAFILEQLNRFHIPHSPDLNEVIEVGGSATFHYIDCMDPYVFFDGTTDVFMSDDWKNYTHVVHDKILGTTYEADPEFVETFYWIKGKDAEFFNEFMSHPGLEPLPWGAGGGIKDLLRGEYNSEDALDGITDTTEEALKYFCRRPDGNHDVERMFAYFELAAWATFVWVMGPLGRAFRYRNHEIFSTCVDYGEATLINGHVVSPEHYSRENRLPKSCHRCGVPAWCTEMTYVDGISTYICEHCLNGEMRSTNMYINCGTKNCRDASCKHNPFYQFGKNGAMNARRKCGQLRKRIDETLLPDNQLKYIG